MDLDIIELILILLALHFIYKSLTKNDDFFKDRGVKFTKPTLLFGNLFKMIISRENGMRNFEKFYRKYDDEKIFGMFMFNRPVFMVKDVEVIKQISIKDFDHFVNHDGSMTRGSDGIIGKSVLMLENGPWREMRNFLTPIFTSAKMKTMYHHLISCAQDLDEFFDETLKEKGRIIIESKDTFGRFTAEAISATTLGFKGDCIKDKNSQVFQLALDMQHDFSSITSVLKFLVIPNIPLIARLFNIKIFRQSIHDFFKKYVTDEIARRESQGITTGTDVIQLLIQAKNGQLKDDSSGVMKEIQKKYTDWNDDELVAAQVFIMFAGGFETTSLLMEMVSWEFAINQDIQKKLIAEIDEVVSTLEGKPVSYEVLNKMKYLDNVVSEGLRKWPPAPVNIRECSKDYTMNLKDGKTVEIKKGDMINIPIRMIQHDPKLFENPDRFDPDRFSDENKHNIVPGSIVAFGAGPRVCLGQRLAIIEAKLILFTILSKYNIEACEKTPKTIKFSYSTFPAFPTLKEPVFVELKPRKK